MKRGKFLPAAMVMLFAGLCAQTALADDAQLQATGEKIMKLVRAGKLAEADEPLTTLLTQTNDPSIPKDQVRMFRGFLRAENGRFEDAATDFEDAISADPSDHVPYFFLAPVLIESGQLDDYRRQCTAMLHRFKDTTNAPVAERTAKCCLLLPAAVSSDDLILTGKVADRAVSLAKKGQWIHWRLMTQGLAEYRQAHFSQCLSTMELAQKNVTHGRDAGREMCQADIYFISAMAHQQLKQTDEAMNAYKHGRVIAMTQMPALDSKNLTQGWVDVLMTYIIMNEAKTTIPGAPDLK